MDSSERVTWENCPVCQRPAAVGWRGGRAVGFDCPGGCSPDEDQLQAIRHVEVRPMVDRLARMRPTPGAARHIEARYRIDRPCGGSSGPR